MQEHYQQEDHNFEIRCGSKKIYAIRGVERIEVSINELPSLAGQPVRISCNGEVREKVVDFDMEILGDIIDGEAVQLKGSLITFKQ